MTREKEKKGKKPNSKRYFLGDASKTKQQSVEVFTPDLTQSHKTKMDVGSTDGTKQRSKEKLSLNVADDTMQPGSRVEKLQTSEVHDLSALNMDTFKQSKAAFRRAFSGGKKPKNVKRDKWSGKKEDMWMKHGKPINFRDMKEDPFPGDLRLPKEQIQKYQRGDRMDTEVRTVYHQKQFKAKEKKLFYAAKQAARSELLMEEEAGFLEADEGADTTTITQHDIVKAVDVASAQKFFELKLDKFGPYRMNYTRNGRFLLIGGGKGHIAAMDWQTKKLMCEVNVMERCQDAKWLHIETMFAVAQKQWTYIYDNQGIELHCLKALDRVLRLEFLPYHFLLASANEVGYISYLDVSVGKKVAGYTTGLGRLDVMCQNPSNAILHLGHSGGTVTLWSPNVKEPLVKMLCHGSGTRSVAVDNTGKYMATSGIDRTLKIWDLRTFKTLQSYKISAGAGQLAFSGRGLLAAGIGNIVEVYKDCCTQATSSPYLTHRLPASVHSLQFCPFEDVLGVGHGAGFSSLLVPGAGEPNFDALEANPFQTKKQRQQAEVQMLLEKVQPEMINLDTNMLGQVDQKTFKEKMDARAKLLTVKPIEKVNFEPKFKKKGKSKAGKFEQRKKGVEFEHKRQKIREQVQQKQQMMREKKQSGGRTHKPYSVFDRFKRTDA